MKNSLKLKDVIFLACALIVSTVSYSQNKVSSFAVTVPVDGNIQTAINQVASAGGGTVNLSAGTYTLSTTLYLKSNISLNGAGMALTNIQIADTLQNVIEDYAEGLSNVTIQNLKVTGKASVTCYGILIQAGTTYHNNVQISNVEVTGAGMGVHFKRINNLNITNSNFHHNGCLSQIGYYHNLYIRSCNQVSVSNCYLNNSISANGLNVSYCKNVTVSNCIADNNYFRGMRAADTDGFAVLYCSMNGNGDVGLLANTEITPTVNINWYKCSVNYNRNGGIKAISGVTGVITSCTATGNSVANYSVTSSVSQVNNK